jgi:hypothetical protein
MTDVWLHAIYLANLLPKAGSFLRLTETMSVIKQEVSDHRMGSPSIGEVHS